MQVFFFATLFFTALFVVLDVFEFARTNKQESFAKLLPGLIIVTTVFGAIQYLLLTLIPSAGEIFSVGQAAAVSGLHGGVLHETPEILVAGSLLIFLFYLGGFVDYAFHRWASHGKWFWFTHEYHHLPSVIANWVPGILVRPFNIVSLIPTIIFTFGIYVLSFKFLQLDVKYFDWVLIVYFLHTLILISSHSMFLRKYRSVHKILSFFGVTSPRSHVLHHTKGGHNNYADLTIVWDRVFGTYIDPEKATWTESDMGLSYNQDFLGTLTVNKLHIPRKFHKFFLVGRLCNWIDKKK